MTRTTLIRYVVAVVASGVLAGLSGLVTTAALHLLGIGEELLQITDLDHRFGVGNAFRFHSHHSYGGG